MKITIGNRFEDQSRRTMKRTISKSYIKRKKDETLFKHTGFEQ